MHRKRQQTDDKNERNELNGKQLQKALRKQDHLSQNNKPHIHSAFTVGMLGESCICFSGRIPA